MLEKAHGGSLIEGGTVLKRIFALLWAMGWLGMAWAQTLDLNQASEMELDGLKGVGPVLTREIMTQRQKAPFKDWTDASRRVKGMGPQKASSLSAQGVRVQGRAFGDKP